MIDAPGGPAVRQATWVARVVDQWVACGLRRVMLAPGSRSTPFAVAFAARPELRVEVFVDERSAAFAALGAAQVDGIPAAVLCTSGTAATHFHAAVVEADLSGVPLLALTADRPPELRGVSAPQTIDQVGLYGGVVRAAWSVCPARTEPSGARGWAGECWRAMTGRSPGPVHANVELIEPLLAAPDSLDAPAIVAPRDPRRSLTAGPAELAGLVGSRGVILAGYGVDDPIAVGLLGERLGWPVLADPRSGCRGLPGAVCAFDALLRVESFAAQQAEAYLQFGQPPASKVLGQWLAGGPLRGAVAVSPVGATIDPWLLGATQVHAPIGAWCRAALAEVERVSARPGDPGWTQRWRTAERAAQSAIEDQLAGRTPSEPGVARLVSRIGEDVRLVVSSSMPIRDLEWFGAPGAGPVVHANRGANGIDGVLATAIGVATHGQPTVAVLGDLAMCHDLSSLAGLAARAVDLCVVVIDNGGGGIFSFLPQAAALDGARFEQLFGTPSGLDLAAVIAAAGLPVTVTGDLGEVAAAISPGTGARFVVVHTERVENVTVHRALNAAIAAAVTAATAPITAPIT